MNHTIHDTSKELQISLFIAVGNGCIPWSMVHINEFINTMINDSYQHQAISLSKCCKRNESSLRSSKHEICEDGSFFDPL